jgi:hypothetical protein
MLKKIFIAKIVLTIFLWALPLTVFPPALFKFFGIPIAGTYLFSRLLGIAYFALIIGYSEGIHQIKNNVKPIRIQLMSILSNGGASIAIGVFGMLGLFGNWGLLGKIYIMSSGVLLFALAVLTFIPMLKKNK